MSAIEQDPSTNAGTGFARFLSEASAPALGRKASEAHEAIVEAAIGRVLGHGDAAGQARRDRSFILDGTTVVMRFDADRDSTVFHADMGTPPPGREAEVFAMLLQHNLHHAEEGITFGMNAHSRRLVATFRAHVFMLDDELCDDILRRLAGKVRALRNW